MVTSLATRLGIIKTKLLLCITNNPKVEILMVIILKFPNVKINPFELSIKSNSNSNISILRIDNPSPGIAMR